MRLLTIALSLSLLLPLASAQDAQPRPLDRKAQKELAALALEFWKARPPHYFKEWNAQTKAAIEKKAAAWGTLPEGSLELLTKIFWKPVKKWGPRVDKKVGGKGILKTPLGDAWFYIKGSGGPKSGMILGLHGGGEGVGSPDTGWSMKGCMGMYPQGIRLVHDTWNTVHGERFILSMIEIAKGQFQVDADRIYSCGFSMGGTGSWFVAGRHPDLLAGAMPCAGVLMASPKSQVASKSQIQNIQHGLVPNVRNLAMWYFIGLMDKNCMPGTYLYVADMLKEMREDDEGGYKKIHFKTYPNLAHTYAPGEPAAGIKYLRGQKRETFPKTLVWEFASNPFPQRIIADKVHRYQKKAFYWLRCKNPMDRQIIRATQKGNRFDLELEGTKDDEKGISIMLNPKMIDVQKKVEVYVDGSKVYEGKPVPKLSSFLLSVNDKADRVMVFDRQIDL